MNIKLTKKEKEFADEYLATGNGTRSALKAYDTESLRVAASIASENLTKPDIRAYIEEHASGAMSRIVELSYSAENETVKLKANQDILDRAGFKPTDRVDVTTLGEKVANVDLDAMAREMSERLKEAKTND
jgi:phage terminase small subunit